MTANRRPFINRLHDQEEISQLVCLVGEATAMELYQGLEINAITQKIVALMKDNPDITIDILLVMIAAAHCNSG